MAREVTVLDAEENAKVTVVAPDAGTIRVQTPVRPRVSAATGMMKGDPGPQGDPGPAGKSAYEVAVENGFEGTEAEWLNYLMNHATGEVTELLVNHINAPEPHPAYDDMIDLTLIYENGLI